MAHSGEGAPAATADGTTDNLKIPNDVDYEDLVCELKRQQPKPEAKEVALTWLKIVLGTIIVAVGVYFFKYPNHFATGGVSGIAVVGAALIPGLSPATLSLIINVALLALGLIVFGKNFAFKTVFVTLFLSGLLVVFEKIVPLHAPLTDEPIIELVIAIALSALGSAILFNVQASSGGTDIIAMIIRKYTSLDIGTALLASDLIVTVSTFFIFNVKVGLFSLTGLFLKGIIVDGFLENFNRVKYFTIITEKPDEIGDFITYVLKRGTTRIDGRGEFTHHKKTVFLTVVKRYQAVMLRDFVKKTDPKAFVMITNTSEIVGRGFHQPF